MNEDAVVIGGLGVVGTATRKMLGIDKYYDLDDSGISMEELRNTKYVFLCLPTPTVEGVCDVSRVRTYIQGLGEGHVYIIRSTVIPGTAQQLALEFGVPVLSCPEFLTEATADVECLHPDLIILGADEDHLCTEVWERLFANVRVDRVVFTDTKTAEFIKYAVNTFYATKVLFANALYDVAQGIGIDYDTVRDAMYARKWIGGNHLTVPWKGTRGVNGKCLPKDLDAFATFSAHAFFEYMDAENEHQTEKARRA